MKVFVVYDSAAEAYEPPSYIRSTGEAIRMFADETKNPNSKLSKHPGDFTLFELGEYDQISGQHKFYEARKNLGTALEYQSKGI